METRRTPQRAMGRLASIRDNPRSRLSNRRMPKPRVLPEKCSECGSNKLSEYEGRLTCDDCLCIVSDSQLVNEIQFSEDAGGRHNLQGGNVNALQRHARSNDPNLARMGGHEPGEITKSKGKQAIESQALHQHRLGDHISSQAELLYNLAVTNNFIQGRQVDQVAAVCIYVVCRRDARNTMLLMDFAERLRVSVFKLGQLYQDLKKALWLDDATNSFKDSGIQTIEVENLIMKFARKLQFGEKLHQVAEDAARLVKRMKRDWMVTGRRPAGIIGACLILAARMNNFRRTVREVVYIVRVADITVAKRMEEFKRTTSSSLTVDQFREKGLRLKRQHDPPSIYYAKERAEKKRKKAERQSRRNSTSSPEVTSRTTTQDNRVDADGFAIPNLPIDPSLLDENDEPNQNDSTPRKRRKGNNGKKTQPQSAPQEIPEHELHTEEELEREMNAIVEDPAGVMDLQQDADDEVEVRARALAQAIRNSEVEALASRRNLSATTTEDVDGAAATSSTDRGVAASRPSDLSFLDNEDIGDDEFADDPEVANCLMTEAECKVKETIWVHHNNDWLRAQQAKALKKALEEALHGGQKKKPARKRKRGRMGDGSVLEGGDPVLDAADATGRMLEKRGKGFSRHINYEKLNEIYKGIRGSSSASKAATEATSTVASNDETDVEIESNVDVEEQDDDNQEQAADLPTPPATQARTTRASKPRGQADDTAAAGEADDNDDDEDEDAAMQGYHDMGLDSEDYDDDEEDDRGVYEDEDDTVGFDD